MTEEEKKAIENLDKRLTIEKYTKNIGTPVYISDLKIALNLIQKQEKEIQIHTKLEQQYKKEYLDLKQAIENEIKEFNKRKEEYLEYIKQNEVTDVEYYESVTNSAIVYVLQKLSEENK